MDTNNSPSTSLSNPRHRPVSKKPVSQRLDMSSLMESLSWRSWRGTKTKTEVIPESTFDILRNTSMRSNFKGCSKASVAQQKVEEDNNMDLCERETKEPISTSETKTTTPLTMEKTTIMSPPPCSAQGATTEAMLTSDSVDGNGISLHPSTNYRAMECPSEKENMVEALEANRRSQSEDEKSLDQQKEFSQTYNSKMSRSLLHSRDQNCREEINRIVMNVRRGSSEYSYAHCAFQRAERAAILVQALVRGHFARRPGVLQSQIVQYKIRCEETRRQKAAVRIQTTTRSCQQTSKYRHIRVCVITIQAFVRASFVRFAYSYYKMHDPETKAAALVVQARKYWFLSQRNKRRKNYAAVTIQAIVRGYLARRPHRLQEYVDEFNRFRAAMDRLKKKTRVAIIVQSLVRGYLARRPYRMQAHILHYAERMNNGAGKKTTEFNDPCNWASLAYFRHNDFCISIQNKDDGVLGIQAVARGFLVRCVVKRQRRAAKQIQSVWRLHRGSRRVTSDKKNMQSSTLHICGSKHSSFRDGHGVRFENIEQERVFFAAVTIQALVRGYLNRRPRRFQAIVVKCLSRRMSCNLTTSNHSSSSSTPSTSAQEESLIIATAKEHQRKQHPTSSHKQQDQRPRPKDSSREDNLKQEPQKQRQQQQKVPQRRITTGAVTLHAQVRHLGFRLSVMNRGTHAITIQAIVRGYLVRQNLSCQVQAATAIQTMWRIHHEELMYAVDRISTILVNL